VVQDEFPPALAGGNSFKVRWALAQTVTKVFRIRRNHWAKAHFRRVDSPLAKASNTYLKRSAFREVPVLRLSAFKIQ